MDQAPTAPRARLRSDAERSRARVVQAARELFATRGLSVGFNDVAHHAGVGVGTVYRRFSTKNELITAALEQPTEDFAAIARDAAGAERAWDGLRALLSELARLLAENLGLREVSFANPDLPESPQARQVREVIEHLLERAAAEGDLRAGVAPSDVIVVLLTASEIARRTRAVERDLYQRYVGLLLDALRDSPDLPPLPPGLDAAKAAEVARRWVRD